MKYFYDKKSIDGYNYTINLSHKHKVILWLWKKCGTTHMSKIMNNFDFKNYKITDDNLILLEDKIAVEHNCKLFHGHEEYEIVAAVRNPYSRFFSEYTFNYRHPKESIYNETNKEKFKSFIYESLVNSEFYPNDCMDFSKRIPDYVVRTENLYEDYVKIPFIVDSDYYRSGELERMTSQKINVSNKDEFLWKKFYTQEIADIVYYRMLKYFEVFGYDKNSWK